jgi:sugar phosphate isomerase/epimerase
VGCTKSRRLDGPNVLLHRAKDSWLSRRELLRNAASILAVEWFELGPRVASAARFSLGACDWSLGQRGRTEALSVAARLGLDGVQVSMGSVENDLHLRRPEVRQAYRDAARASGLQIGGVALDLMNQVPYKSDERTVQWVSDSIDVAQALGVRVVLLAFFEKGDLRDDPAGQAEVVRRLKAVAPKAERQGVVLGIESWLSAAQHRRIIDAVGSRHVQVYYDLANSTQMGYDISSEIRQLGRELICEFHAKENGYLLGQGRIDFAAVRKAMDDIGYSGWIQIEGAIPKGQPMFESYIENVRFMQAQFGEAR